MGVYVAGTYDTKGKELAYIANIIRKRGLVAVLVDLSTSGDEPETTVDVRARDVAAYHPKGAGEVFTGDRGSSVAEMAVAFEAFILSRRDIDGLIGAGGSGGTALVTRAMRALPIGTPRVMVSTLAAGNVSAYVGPNDIVMLNSVTDVAGLNRVSRVVLGNGANAIAGMAANRIAPAADDLPAIGLSMFGVTTPAVTKIVQLLGSAYECLVFHATGIGGQSLEKLADGGHLAGVFDITTTEVCDLLFGGILPASEDRFGFLARRPVPYVGSCGALDMVNFGAMSTVPERFRSRNLYVHNPQITLMRTTRDENVAAGKWIAHRLNQSIGEVRFLIPEGGLSLLDAPGQPFHDPEADGALFETLEEHIVQTEKRRVIRVPHAINDAGFASIAVNHFGEISKG